VPEDDRIEKKWTSSFDASDMPESIRKLIDVMIAINPEWNLMEWLEQVADEELNMLSADIDKELLHYEQRMHRLTSISRRMGFDISLNKNVDRFQKNLFDCFNLEIDEKMKNDVIADEELGEAPPSIGFLLNSLPGELSDDPFLVVAAQLVLVELEKAESVGEHSLPGREIFSRLENRGLSEYEIKEAIEHLLSQGTILEVDEDEYSTA